MFYLELLAVTGCAVGIYVADTQSISENKSNWTWEGDFSLLNHKIEALGHQIWQIFRIEQGVSHLSMSNSFNEIWNIFYT